MSPRDHGSHAGSRRSSEHGGSGGGSGNGHRDNGSGGEPSWGRDAYVRDDEEAEAAQPDLSDAIAAAAATAVATEREPAAGATAHGGAAGGVAGEQPDGVADGTFGDDGPAADGGDGARTDDEMDAFFPSVARAAATGQDIGAALDEHLLVKALAERDEYLDALRRLQADFENFRKRTDRQLAEVRSRASESLLERLLPVLDALDLALAHLGAGGAASNGAAGAGAGGADDGETTAQPAAGEARSALVQVGNLLRDTLAKEGLERIDAVGVAFDPTVHDAVAHVPEPAGEASGEHDSGEAVVDEVMRAGYLLKGRVLRPAMVKVRG